MARRARGSGPAGEVEQLEGAPRRRWPSRSLPESLWGKFRSRSPSRRWLARDAALARIQLRLPARVLISPLWAMRRYGCASGQDGKVFVEEPRVHDHDTGSPGARRSGPGRTPAAAGGEHPLVDDRPRRQRREVDADLGVLDPLSQDEALALEGVAAERPRPGCGPVGPARDEELGEPRRARPRHLACRGQLDGHLALSRELPAPPRRRARPRSRSPSRRCSGRSGGRPSRWRSCRARADRSPLPANRAGGAAAGAPPRRHRCRDRRRRPPGGRGSRGR